MFDKLINYTTGGFSLGRILIALLVLVVCLLVSRVLLRIFERAYAKAGNRNLRAFLLTAVKLGLYVISILITMSYLGIPITPLVTVVGVAGLAVSLALQDTLGNMFSGLMLLSSKPFVVGDYVSAGSFEGEVTETGLVHTRMRTPDNKIVVVPNGNLAKLEITNYSAEPLRRVDVVFSAAYSSSADVIRAAFLRAADSIPDALNDPAPFLGVTELGEKGVRYSARVWCKSTDYWGVFFAFNEALRKELQASGAELELNRTRLLAPSHSSELR